MGEAIDVCTIHYDDIEEKFVSRFSNVTFQQVQTYAEKWSLYDKETEGEIAKAFCAHRFTEIPSDKGFHRRCYARFVDKRKFERVSSRKGKRKTHGNNGSEEVPKKRLRSASMPSTSHFTSGKASNILPKDCLFCHSEKKIRDQKGKRQSECLTRCETLQASYKIVEMAQRRMDEKMLSVIGTDDLVAREAHYHRSCYRKYMHLPSNLAPRDKVLYEKGFDHFKKVVIEPKLVDGKEIVSMKWLHKRFIQSVIETEGIESPSIYKYQLKERIQSFYPNLVFTKRFRKSELVSLQSERMRHFELRDSSTDSNDSSEDLSDTSQVVNVQSPTKRREAFYAAMELRKLLKSAPSLQAPWPPTAEHLTNVAAQSMVPEGVFNFLALATGCSDEPCFSSYAKVTEEKRIKLLSISQDLIFLASNGRKATPKHFALSLAVRHLTASAHLLKLLNSFGHCIGHTQCLEYDTSLAHLRLQHDMTIPFGFETGKFSTLVLDNNDFNEETLSGKGTTHNTSGILIQRVSIAEERQSEYRQSLPKQRVRTVNIIQEEFKSSAAPPKTGPKSLSIALEIETEALKQKQAFQLDMTYILSKIGEDDTSSLFNTKIFSGSVPPMSRIGFLPIIDASPTKWPTISAIVDKTLAIADTLNLNNVVVVFDQAIYCKVQQMRWNDPNLENRLVVRLGEFHTVMAFLAVIGKRFQDAGLREILIDSEVVAEGSINGVLGGHHYNRSVRAHKIIYEALFCICWEAFLESIPSDEVQIVQDVAESIRKSFPLDTLNLVENDSQLQNVMDGFQMFVGQRKRESKLFAFWFSYLEMMEAMLQFIRATRQGDWTLHLSSLRLMMPWYFAYDRPNYSRFSCIYWVEMKKLEKTHPWVYQRFLDGEFVVQRTNNAFSQLACDQTIEQTFNRDTKTKAGLTGITQNKNAVHRWILSQHLRADISRACDEMAHSVKTAREKKDMDRARSLKDFETVETVKETVLAFKNPFIGCQDDLIHIASGRVASKETTLDLLEARQKGETQLQGFLKSCVYSKDRDFYASIRKNNLATFTTKKEKRNSKDTVEKQSANILSRLLVLGNDRKLTLKETLKYNLGSWPQSLANPDGSIYHSPKFALLNYLVESRKIQTAQTVPENSAWIFDGLAVIQQLSNFPNTFAELATLILKLVLARAEQSGCKRVDFVTDSYPELSIKGGERSRRMGNKDIPVFQIVRPDQKLPKRFHEYLREPRNKKDLLDFFATQWSKCDPSIICDVDFFYAYDNKCRCYKVKAGIVVSEDITELSSDHEEADTRMFLHAHHAEKQGFSNIVIVSQDTDVIILAMATQQDLSSDLYIQAGTKKTPKTFNIKKAIEHFSPFEQTALIGMHVFSGCDTISSFRGKGKIKPLELTLGRQNYITAFMNLGKEWTTSGELEKTLENFTLELYGCKTTDDIDEGRYLLFSSKIDNNLPPTRDSLLLHIQRANYQCAIHRKCLKQFIEAPDPLDHGWRLCDKKLLPLWSIKEAAPKELLNPVSCGCIKSSCTSRSCKCQKNSLMCTNMCKCTNCKNAKLPENDENMSDLSDED